MGKTRVAASTADEQEIAEARGSTLPDMLYDVVARVATTSVGQFVYKRVDNLLWTVEKTARWSLPQPLPTVSEKAAGAGAGGGSSLGTDESEEPGIGISGPPLIRPLPWLLFLPALIVLRLIRTALSMGTRVIGRGPVLPSTMVSFLQNKRRKLRALKYRGQRLQRIARLERSVEERPTGAAATSWLQRIILPLKMVICTGPLRTVDANSDVAHAVVFRKGRPSSAAAQKRSGGVASKKRNLNQREAESDDEVASEEESFEDAGCKELLEKYANMVDDSSFNVEDISSVSDDSCSSEQSDVDPSPKKPILEAAGKSQSQPNGAQHQPSSKAEQLKRSASEHKNGADTQSPAGNAKSINTANRSKSAAEIDKGANPQPAGGSEGKSNATTATDTSTTPSKSIPNLSSSPENNENKPMNQNTSGGSATAAAAAATAAQLKSPPSPATVLKPVAKQSPTMSDVRHSFQQQKQTGNSKTQPASATTAQPSQQPSTQNQHQPPQHQHMSNGAKNRAKKASTQSAA